MSEARARARSALRTQRFDGYDGVTLCAAVGGNPAGSCVVLLHGGGQTHHAWRKTSSALAASGAYVVAYDLRGHGDSGWSADRNYGIDAQCADLRAVIERLPRTRPAVIGASMGGLIALTTAGEYPDLIERLVLVDVTPQIDLEGRARIIGFMKARPEGFATIEAAAAAVADYLPHRTRPSDPSGLKRNLRQHADGRWRWHWDPALLDSFEPDHATAVERYSAAARHIRARTLLLRGGRSGLVKPEHIRHFQQLIPHASYEDVADAEHMIAGDRNDAFNEAVLRFFGDRAVVAGRSGL